MTGKTESTLVEECASSYEGAQGLAAANLAGQVARLLSAALAASPLDQKDLAARIGVSEGRVSQVVNSDGNLRVAAVARYMRALGYELTIAATPLEEGLPPLPRPSRRPRREDARVTSNKDITPCRHADDEHALVKWSADFSADSYAIRVQLAEIQNRLSTSTRELPVDSVRPWNVEAAKRHWSVTVASPEACTSSMHAASCHA